MLDRPKQSDSTGETVWRSEELPCPSCESNERRYLGRRGGTAHRDGKGTATGIVECRDCGVIYTFPTLIPETNPYERHSADEYFQEHEIESRIESGTRVAAYAEQILGKPGKVLELGCGRGEFLQGAMRRGWDAYGIEMTEGFADVARSSGVRVDVSSISESKLLDEKFDLIMLEAILEHLYDPVETLKRVRDALRPGGLLFVEVPNERSLAMRFGNAYMKLNGRDWVVNLSPTFPPFHVIGFSPVTLRRFLERFGFEIHSIETPRWPNVLPENGGLRQKLERRVFGAVQKIGSAVGSGDGIICWARVPV